MILRVSTSHNRCVQSGYARETWDHPSYTPHNPMNINPLDRPATTAALRLMRNLTQRSFHSPRKFGSITLPVLAVCLLLCLPGIASSNDDPVSRWYGEWLNAPAAEIGFDNERLQAAIARIGQMHGVQGLLVVRHGYLIAERYWRGGAREVPHNLKSASKSIISALTGIAIEQGHFGLDQPIVELLPQLDDIDDSQKKRITVRHLLEMTSGLRSNSYEAYDVWVTRSDWVQAALSGPMQSPPGSRYDYNTANTHLLSAIIAQTTGGSTRAFAEKHLFGKIGVRIHDWSSDPNGIHIGGNNLWLMPRDIARFGQLFLDQGRWGKRRVIPADWVTSSVRTLGKTTHDTYGGYGYLWWTPFADGTFAAVGFGGQYIIVSPHDDTVIVVTSTLDSKGDHWEQALFGAVKDGVAASIVHPQLPLMATTEARVNLRAGPGVEHATLSVVAASEPAQWFGSEGDWQRVRVRGKPGWLHGDYLAVEQPAEVAPPATTAAQLVPTDIEPDPVTRDSELVPVPAGRIEQLREQIDALQSNINAPLPLPRYRITRTVNFRHSPSLQGELIGKLNPDTEFQAMERSEAWLMAEIEGAQGWLHSDFAEVTERPTLATQRAGLIAGVEAVRSAADSLRAIDGEAASDTDIAQLLNDARAERDALQQQLDGAQQNAASLRADLERNEQRLAQAQTVYDEELTRLHQHSDNLSAIARQVKSELEVLIDEKAQQSQTLAAQRERMQMLIAEAAAQRAEKQQLRTELDLLSKFDQQRETLRNTDREQLAALEREVDQAVNQLRGFEQRVQDLSQENARLTDELAVGEQRHADLTAQLRATALTEASLRGDVAQLQDKNRALDEALSELQSRSAAMLTGRQLMASDLEQKLDALAAAGTTNEQLSAALAASKARVSRLDEKLNAKQEIEIELHRRLAESQQRSRQLDEDLGAARAEITVLEQTRDEQGAAGDQQNALLLAETRAQLAEAARTAAAAQQDRDALQDRLARETNALADKEQALQLQEQHVASLRTELEQEKATTATLTQDLGAQRAERIELVGEMQLLLGQVNLQQRQIVQLHATAEQAQRAVASSDAALTEAAREHARAVTALEKNQATLGATRDKAKQLERQLTEQQAALAALTAEQESVLQRNTTLRTAVAESEQQHAALRDQFGRLQEAHDALMLQSQLAEADSIKQHAQITQDAEHIATLTRQLEQAAGEVAGLKDALRSNALRSGDLGSALAMLWNQNGILQTRNGQMHQQLSEAARDAAQHQQRHEHMQQVLADRDTRISALNKEMADTARAGNAMADELTELHRQAETRNAELKQAGADLQARDNAMALIQDRLDEALRASHGLEDHIGELQVTNANQAAKLASMDKSTAEANAAVAQAQLRHDQLQLAYVEKEAANDRLAAQLTAVKERLQASDRQLAETRQATDDAIADSDTLRKQLSTAQDRLQSIEQAQPPLLSKLAAAEQANRDLQAQAEARDRMIIGLRADIALLGRENRAIGAELDKLMTRQAGTLEQATADRVRLETENARLAQQIEQTATQAQSAQHEAERQAALNVERETDLNRQSAQAERLQTLLGEKTRLHRELADELAEQGRKNRDLADQRALQTEREQQSQAALEHAQSELATLRSQLKLNATALAQAESANKSMRAELAIELEQLQQRVTASEALAQASITTISDRDRRLEHTAKLLQHEQAQTAALKTQLTELENQIGARDIELSTYRTVERHLNATLAQVSELQRSADARENDSKSMIAAVDRLQAAYDQRQQELRDLRTSNAAQTSALRRARLKIRELEQRQLDQGSALRVAGHTPAQAAVPQKMPASARPAVMLASAQGIVSDTLSPSSVAQLQPSAAGAAQGLASMPRPSKDAPPAVMPVAQQPTRASIKPLVQRWAAAWARQDVDGYLSFYSARFEPAQGIGLKQWQAQRRARITKPEKIEVKVSRVEIVAHDDDRAQVSFDQAYQANHYRDRVRKTLDLQGEDGKWKIVREVGS